MTKEWRALCLLIGLALPGAAIAAEPCTWPAGMPANPLVLVGEMHGTAQTPAFVGELACAASMEGAAVVVALEIPPTEQPRLDAFIASTDTPSDRAALLAEPFWTRRMQDGRSSAAMLALLQRLQALRAEGRRVDVVAVDDMRRDLLEDGIAARIRLAASIPGMRVIALLGNRHASQHKGVRENPEFAPAGYLLADLQPLSVLVDAPAGSAWVCAPACGVRAFGGRRPTPAEVSVGYIAGTAGPGYDGTYTVPRFTASLPAVAPAPQELTPPQPLSGT